MFRVRILFFCLLISICLFVSALTNTDKTESLGTTTDFVLCRHCGSDIASAGFVVNLASPAAEHRKNHTLFELSNVHVQILVNPFNVQFSIITVRQANCQGTGQWNVENSWYPGYAWKSCACPHCSHHLGWLFEPLATATVDRKYASKRGFYGLILDSVISEKYSNSLLAIPKYSFRKQEKDEL